jgi:hypothetical protein
MDNEFTRILSWLGYRFYCHEIDEKAKTLQLRVRRKRGNRKIESGGCGQKFTEIYDIGEYAVRDVRCIGSGVKENLHQRQRRASSRPPVTEVLRGSLLERTIRHKRGCPKCARGEGHPALVLTVGYPGGLTKQFSLRPEMKAQVQQWLHNYRQLKAKLEAVRAQPHLGPARKVGCFSYRLAGFFVTLVFHL